MTQSNSLLVFVYYSIVKRSHFEPIQLPNTAETSLSQNLDLTYVASLRCQVEWSLVIRVLQDTVRIVLK